MGAFAAVAQGTDTEPALIVLRYEGAGADAAPALGLVGKAVTFDTGGISIKPAAKMHEMKFDMSGGAAVLEAMGAIAALELPINVVAVVGATENMPSGHAMKPGDVFTAMNGTTIEVNNTDAEGRLVLADCLAHAVDLGAERLVDVATLTGAIVIALGTTYSGLCRNDDDWAAEVSAAGEATGELVWRLPLHEEYADLIKGRYADITNAVEGRKAGSITAAEFLKRFTSRRARGRTSTSPGPATTPARRTRPRAAPASRCGCSSSSPAAWRRSDEGRHPPGQLPRRRRLRRAVLGLAAGPLEIVRTRDASALAAADARVDVGGKSDPATGDFDHHQRGGAGERPNGVRYASFGLVWKHYGAQLAGRARGGRVDRRAPRPGRRRQRHRPGAHPAAHRRRAPDDGQRRHRRDEPGVGRGVDRARRTSASPRRSRSPPGSSSG